MIRERRLLIILISLIILAIILGGIFYLDWKSIRATEEIIKDFDKERGYKVFQLSADNDGILTETFFITTKDDIVLDARIIETGYSKEELEYKYIDISGFLIMVYNVEKGEDYLVYNDNIYNSMSVHDIIKEYKKDNSNLIVREF